MTNILLLLVLATAIIMNSFTLKRLAKIEKELLFMELNEKTKNISF